MNKPKPQYTHKVDQLFNMAKLLGFTRRDFADVAWAAADQAGARPATTMALRADLDSLFDDSDVASSARAVTNLNEDAFGKYPPLKKDGAS